MINNKNEENEITEEKAVEEIEQEKVVEETNNDDSITKSSSIEKSKVDMDLVKKLGIVTGLIILLILIIFLVMLLFKEEKSYTDMEYILKSSAESYFDNHKSELPQDDTKQVIIEDSILISLEYMEDFSKYSDDLISCSGKVTVSKKDNTYIYEPFLDCGKEYTTTKLFEEIISDENIITTGYGLYKTNNGYSYRGELVNNYIELDGNLWRIVNIQSDNNMTLILDDKIKDNMEWDNRYNSTENQLVGINEYEKSRIREYLVTLYDDNVIDDGLELFSNSVTEKLVEFNACTGKRSISSTDKNNSIECAQVIENENISLLTASDYMMASTDATCESLDDKSCQNYNYLLNQNSWFLMTANDANSYEVYKVFQGSLSAVDASKDGYVRPVVKLSNSVLYKSGNGTMEKPYKLK